MLRRVGRLVWIAATPLALTVLAAQPDVRAQSHEGAHGSPFQAEAPATPTHGAASPTEPTADGEEHVVSAPIQNFADFGYKSKDSHGGPYEKEAGDHPLPPPFSMALLNFAVLAFILFKFAGPGIRRYLRTRHKEIADALAESARLREQAQRTLEEYNRKLATLDAEIDALVTSIRTEAEAEKRRIIDEAAARAERMKKDAAQQIDAEIARARMTLEREAVQAAVAVAERLLRERTNEADQRALADRYVKQLPTAAAARQ